MLPARVKRLLVLLAMLGLCVAALLFQRHLRGLRTRNQSPPMGVTSDLLAQLSALEQRERHVDETVWAPERRAEQCGSVFDALWDKVNAATNKLNPLTFFPINQMLVSQYGNASNILDEIQFQLPVGPNRLWRQADWQAFLQQANEAGWTLSHIEFRQRAFDAGGNGQPERSHFSFRADVENSRRPCRATLEGTILVTWTTNASTEQPAVQQIDATQVSIRSLAGQIPFEPVFTETIVPPENWLFIDPLILYDLNGDGLSEIILAGKNLVYRRQPNGRYEANALCKYPPGRLFTAVIADFDGDGIPDFLCAKPEGLLLFHGSAGVAFDEPGRLVWSANPPLKYAQVLTCADVNGDGSLDVFLAQYKSPYLQGQMPTPFYDANDGEPAYLLLNNGDGNFTDATERCGLSPKRGRRSYSASFARLTGDRKADLIVVSDFAGLDLYASDGHGRFIDSTSARAPVRSGFGMAHALADFNVDGILDLLMIGMDSPTVDRLNYLRLERTNSQENREVRNALVAGNRLLTGLAEGRFAQMELGHSIAHSGWSWGCGVLDLNNDSFPDVYIANGHESRATVAEYEPEFWLHDIYVSGSSNSPAASLYFQSKFTRTRGAGYSYGGYEQNRLYLNGGGQSFVEAGYLLGVGLQQDCRNVVADDLDGDGRMDLLVTTFEVAPVPRQTLHVYQNHFASPGNWIGFRFCEQGKGKFPVTTRITIQFNGRSATGQIVTGDSYRAQKANAIHFGLGTAARVDAAEINWPNGKISRIETPLVNHWHLIRQPDE